MPLRHQTGWYAVITKPGAASWVGALRRSPRLHWSAAAAQREVMRWVRQLRLGPEISWDHVESDVQIASLASGHIAIVGNIALPEGDPPGEVIAKCRLCVKAAAMTVPSVPVT